MLDPLMYTLLETYLNTDKQTNNSDVPDHISQQPTIFDVADHIFYLKQTNAQPAIARIIGYLCQPFRALTSQSQA